MRDLVRLEHPDDLSDCYTRVAETVRVLKQGEPAATLWADYTGGTKTMSVALALIGLDYDFALYVTSGTRRDIVKIERGELTRAVGTSSISAQRFLSGTLPDLQENYSYQATKEVVRRLLVTGGLDTQTRERLQQLGDLCAAFDAWDSFDHREAWALLEPYMSDSVVRPLGIFLRKVIGCRAQIDSSFTAEASISGHGYELVEDLVLNAERRAAQRRFDDAVGRLYRALELLAQLRLHREHELTTGNLEVSRLPQALQEHYEGTRDAENGSVDLGLVASYDLLARLDDPLGQLYRTRESAVKDTLRVRNGSLFAHGFKPVTKTEYSRFETVTVPFLEEGVALGNRNSKAPQFPTTF